MCNCNNHSTECVFDGQVYAEMGQTSGGMCLNCDGNTDGRQCETCAPFYYPRPDKEQTDPNVCQGDSQLLHAKHSHKPYQWCMK